MGGRRYLVSVDVSLRGGSLPDGMRNFCVLVEEDEPYKAVAVAFHACVSELAGFCGLDAGNEVVVRHPPDGVCRRPFGTPAGSALRLDDAGVELAVFDTFTQEAMPYFHVLSGHPDPYHALCSSFSAFLVAEDADYDPMAARFRDLMEDGDGHAGAS